MKNLFIILLILGLICGSKAQEVGAPTISAKRYETIKLNYAYAPGLATLFGGYSLRERDISRMNRGRRNGFGWNRGNGNNFSQTREIDDNSFLKNGYERFCQIPRPFVASFRSEKEYTSSFSLFGSDRLKIEMLNYKRNSEIFLMCDIVKF